ncbi:unnamed protein product [Ilex paraguariensis]|uniref:Uncharacterized protein n=1 Tax=Ilex paraguariensis TaxID=185542 RepID=A0ABC8SKV9_9AQUA
MHARHRSPGNGTRSTYMGLGGVAATSRISPEGSFRNHGINNPDYRGYNRSFGRGQSKPFQPPRPPPRRGDIFVEAGRLATEYLVSKGLLPPNVLSGKWQNGSLKVGEFPGFRAQEAENLLLPMEGRTSALSRLGNAGSDVGSGRRRFPDEYNSAGLSSYIRGRKRTGSFKDYGLEWSREPGRIGSSSDKARASPDVEGNDDAFSGYLEEQQVNNDGSSGVQKSPPDDLAPESDGVGDSESALEKYQLPDNVSSKGSSPSTGKDLQLEANMESIERTDDMTMPNMDAREVKDGSSNDEKEKQSAMENTPIHHCGGEVDIPSKSGNDLLRLCSFAKVPTRIRSSLTTRGSKLDPVPITKDENTHENELPIGPGAAVEELPVGGSSGDASSNQTQSSEGIGSDALKAPAVQEAGELALAYAVGQGKCTRSKSFPERTFMNELESNVGPPGFMERGEKRVMHDDESRDGTKKLREWAPSIDTPDDDCLRLSNSMEKQQTSKERTNTPGEGVILAADQTRVDISLFPKCGAEQCIEYAEEKQLIPGSFKTFDLNLMEASDVNENQNSDTMLIFPSITESEKAAAPVDIDLSMSNKGEISDKYGRHGANGKEIEVIDLENDSIQEDKAFNDSERKDETVYTGLESFPTHAHNSNDMPDVQDGYGLMISELLGNDIPSCSSVSADINFLHNDMGLDNGEGILGDDDSIYMSLGEIPSSMPEL